MAKLTILKKNIKSLTLIILFPVEKENYVKKIIPKYSLTEGITEKIYRKLIEQVLQKIPELDEWHSSRNT